jgi:hypothetical protein
VPTLVEKTVLVTHKVSDLWGLLMDLRRADFKVRNVGSDSRGTYIHLEPDEEKDPAPIVEAWVGKPAPKPSMVMKEIRIKELKKVKEDETLRMAERIEQERKREEARVKAGDQVETGQKITEPEGQEDISPKSTSLLRKIFRKFF